MKEQILRILEEELVEVSDMYWESYMNYDNELAREAKGRQDLINILREKIEALPD